MPSPPNPKIYHITHVDRVPSIVLDRCLWCDNQVRALKRPGTKIGFDAVKKWRLEDAPLSSHPGLHVGQCVPFYFSVRPPMLHVIHQRHPELTYKGGQDPIVYLEADLRETVKWADEHDRRWAFTTSNAGAREFEDFADLDRLDEIDWDAVQRRNWHPEIKHGKQAEFLVEWSFPWALVSRVCVRLPQVQEQVRATVARADHQPQVECAPGWYFK